MKRKRIQHCGLVAALIVAIMAASALYVPTTARASSVTGKYIKVTLERTDNLGDKIYVGDTLTYKVTYTNVSNTDFVAYPKESNLTNVAVGDTKSCRWSPLKVGQTASCSFPFHVVTQHDVATGFTPYVIFDAAANFDNTLAPHEAGVKVTADKVTVVGSRPDPAATPTPRIDGVPIKLAGPGMLGFDCTRIVALAVAPNNDLVAAFDGRPGGCGDAPNPNSIIVRISSDQGQSWSEPAVAIQGSPDGQSGSGKYGFSDPSFVVDRQAGKIFLFSVKSFNAGLLASVAGVNPTDPNVLQAQVSESDDNGVTWSEPRIITKDITPDPKYTSRFASSGAGIQLKYGPHAGRLVQQYAVLYNEKLDAHAVSVYSDDHGATWIIGQPTAESGMDENKVVELSNGDLMMNSRSSDNSIAARRVAISKDAGQTWGPVTTAPELIDSHNNASIIRAFPDSPKNSTLSKVLLFSNAATTSGRHTGTVRVSADDGKTWFTSKVFEPGNMEYSTLVALPEVGKYGLLYEAKPNGIYQIQYEQISLDWLGMRQTVDPQSFVVGSPVNYVVPVLIDGATTLTKCEATGLPAGLRIGLTVDKTACVVTGTPMEIAKDAAVNVAISYQADKVPAIFLADATITVNPARSGDARKANTSTLRRPNVLPQSGADTGSSLALGLGVLAAFGAAVVFHRRVIK